MAPEASAARRRPREPLVDALRALALLGVLVVNAQSYSTGPMGTPLGLPSPAAGTGAEGLASAAASAHALVAAVFQGKAYPVLAFLFGYGFGMSAARRGEDFLAHRRRRMRRLLALGLAHGLLLFSGDILTIYAVCGLLLLALGRWRSATLARALGLATALAFGVWLLLVGLAWMVPAGEATAPELRYAQATTVAAYLKLNAVAYLEGQLWSLWLFAPEVLALMMAGVLAARLRLLGHRRWLPMAARVVRHQALPALALNLAYGLVVWAVAPQGEAALWRWVALAMPAGWWLAAVWLCAGVVAWHRGAGLLRRLVPLGRYTLSLYVASSALWLLGFSGLGVWPDVGTLGLLAVSVCLWLAAAALAGRAAAAGWQGPLEAWMNRA